jgi:small subunit ribosomal protein S21
MIRKAGSFWAQAGKRNRQKRSPSLITLDSPKVKLAEYALKMVQFRLNPDQIDPRFNVSSIMGEALWQVWRWDSLAEVRVQEGEPLENALRRFKRKVQQEDIIKEVKRHSYYLKPGEKKRVKAALARKRNRKKARKEAD